MDINSNSVLITSPSSLSTSSASNSSSLVTTLLSIKVRFVDLEIVKTLQFNPSTLVFDALKIIREKIPETSSINAENYGIFITNNDVSKGTWLENGRSLEYYMLKNGDTIEYRNKFRKLNIKILDGQTKSLMVDDSQTVGQLMIYICSQMGIANYEEYSLINEMSDNEKEKYQTIKKDKTLHRDHKKMEELKKKLHTDDDIAWLDHSKTLRQQKIDENSILILKRKFFFSDKNIDTRDPVQLNLLYVQCRDAIINGTHPITEEEAIKFAAFQCQIKNGDYVEQKKSPGLDLKVYLPKEYVKVKGIEKKIIQEYKTLIGLNELEAKLKYTQLCRSLKTYGVTFFLVKEKMKGKNKLVARLLGITKESILRVDEKTKEFLNVYPLECVKKWAASPNTFTLDFGDHYKEQYYSMQTTEGEHIARLISGYIDIILKKKKAREYTGMDADEETPMLEEVISPSKATVIQINKTSINQSVSGNLSIPVQIKTSQTIDSSNSTYQINQIQNRQTPQINPNQQIDYELQRAQRPLITTIQTAKTTISQAQSNLDQRPDLGDIGNDPVSLQWKTNMIDVNKQNVSSHLSAMNAATAQVVTLTSNGPQHTDYNAVGAAVSCISTNLGDFSKDVCMIAALQQHDQPQNPPENDRLLDAAKKLCSAFSEFLRYVEPDCNEPRQNMFGAVGKIGEAGNEVARSLNRDADSTEPKLQETFIGLAKLVASSTAGLVIASKNVANHCENQQGVNEVISMVTQCALSTSQLVSCTKVCSSTISSKECQDQIVEAARQVSRHVDSVMDVAVANCRNEQALIELRNCANNVTESVVQLLDNVRASNEQILNFNNQNKSIEKIHMATDYLFESLNNPSEMIRQAKNLAVATTELINSLKQEAHGQTSNEQQRKLLLAAKLLAEATSKIVEAAKGCASNPNNENLQISLKKAVDDLKNATNIAMGDNLQFRAIKKLEFAARQAASCATQAIAAIQVCTVYSSEHDLENIQKNQNHIQLIQQCKIVADHVPKLVQAIRGCMVKSTSKNSHFELINSCEDFLNPTQKMLGLTRSILPSIVDEIKAIQLRNCSSQLTGSLNELKTCLSKAQELNGSFDSDLMIESIRQLKNELDEIKQAAFRSSLKPLPGETLELCEAQLAALSKTVGLSMAQMLTAAAQGNEIYTGISAKETLNSLKTFTNSIRAISACSTNKNYQDKLIDSAHLVLEQSITLVNESKQALLNQNNSSDNQQRLIYIARQIAQSLYECVNCLPGQKDIDDIINSLSQYSTILYSPSLTISPFNGDNLNQLEFDLNQIGLHLNHSSNQIYSDSRHASQNLSNSSNEFANWFEEFCKLGLQMASLHNNQQDFIQNLRELYSNSNKLLHSAKSILADPNALTSKQQLLWALKQVTQSINSIITLCDLVDFKECDNTIRNIETIMNLVDNVISEPTCGTLISYYDCLEKIIEQSRLLGESVTGVANSCKSQNLEIFTKAIRDTSISLTGLVEASIHSAYLIGVSDAESKPGKSPILDSNQFINYSQKIQDICSGLQILITGKCLTQEEQKQLIQAATQIAHNTAGLCNISQVASSKTNNIISKRHFVQSAKQVANSTAYFVKIIKSIEGNFEFTEENYKSLVKPLLDSVDNLCQYALSPEFSGLPAVISENGAISQKPIIESVKILLTSSLNLVQCSKNLIQNNKDPQQWQFFSNNSKLISDSIKKLATSIKEKAPAKLECELGLNILDKCTKHLENVLLSVKMNQPLQLSEQANLKSLQIYQEHALTCANQMLDLVDQVGQASKCEADKLAHLIMEFLQYFESLVVNVIGCTAKTPFDSKKQLLFLEQTKTVVESVYQLMLMAKENAGNPKNFNLHQQIDENCECSKEVLSDLIETLEQATAQNGYVHLMVDNISKAIDRVDLSREVDEEDFSQKEENELLSEKKQLIFVNEQTKIFELIKQIQENVKDISICSSHELGSKAQLLTQNFNFLIQSCKLAINTCASKELSQRLKVCTQDLGKSCIDLINLAGRLQQEKILDKTLKKELLSQIEIVETKSVNMLHAFKTSAKGTQACISAGNAVNGIIADLNTVIMFATAGTLRSETESDSLGNHRELILRSAKMLVEDTKSLVSASGTTCIDQEELAQSVQTSVKTMIKLSDAVKLGAASLGSDQPDAQVLLINSVKDVSTALSNLISTIKLVSSNNTPNRQSVNLTYSASLLSESAKNMITSVQSLLKTVKTVEDEAQRGTRALESAIEAISQEIKIYSTYAQSDDESKQKLNENIQSANPEDLIKATKQITMATSRSIGAANSLRQEDIIQAANLGRKAVSDLLFVSRAFALDNSNTDKDLLDCQQEVLNVGINCSTQYKELLEFIQTIFNKTTNGDDKQNLVIYSKNVANSVSEILQLAECLKGSDWVDPEDPTVIAENELLNAALAIESAAKKLSNLKPRATEEAVSENLNFDEQILEAAKSVTNAAGVLIKAATTAQKELVAQGKFKPLSTSNDDDGQWSQGLISAAKMVAAACHTLCEAANGLVQGHGTEERLISSAKQVASSTAALLVACKVKSDMTSQAMKRLQHAGNAIKRATDALVRAAQQAVDVNEEDQMIQLNTKFVGSMAQEIMLREEILRKERELRAAQAAYSAVKKARYQREEHSPGSNASSGSSTAHPASTITNHTNETNGTFNTNSNFGPSG
ncbi:unnamed protein product [Brachionus calyciflorus]|uniref:Talin n=1 Tax=Brachionus calyciflorus TaxID=104777 RepID=A0A813P4C0_9BILA|nr:unnamed protein product [Brachionus calyciflorus]